MSTMKFLLFIFVYQIFILYSSQEAKIFKKLGKKTWERYPEEISGRYNKRNILQPPVIKKQFDDEFAPLHNKYEKYTISKRNEGSSKTDATCKSTLSPAREQPSKKDREKLVSDHSSPDGNKLIEVPIKESHDDVKLSEVAYETEGDKVADTLDFCNAKIFHGQKADEELKRLKSIGTENP